MCDANRVLAHAIQADRQQVIDMSTHRHYRFVRANTGAERMMREVMGALGELKLPGRTVAVGAVHGALVIDPNGSRSVVVSVRAYPDWSHAAPPVLDRRSLRAAAIIQSQDQLD